MTQNQGIFASAKQCTYGDFLKSDEKIATNILASRLQALEENGIKCDANGYSI